MSINDNDDDDIVVKAINRREVNILSDGLFRDYESTYGKDADAKLLSWKLQKEMKNIMNGIFSTIGLKRSELSSDIALELVSETYYDLIELQEVLKTRIEIAKMIEQNEDIDEDLRCVFAESNDLDILRGIIQALKEFSMDEVPTIIEHILGIRDDTAFFDIHIEDVIEYYHIRRSCAFPRVLEFLDDKFYMFYAHDSIYFIIKILDEYSESKINLPFSEESKQYLISYMGFLKDTGVFDKKDEDSLIKLINAVFVWVNEISQIEEQSFDPIVQVLKKENI